MIARGLGSSRLGLVAFRTSLQFEALLLRFGHDDAAGSMNFIVLEAATTAKHE